MKTNKSEPERSQATPSSQNSETASSHSIVDEAFSELFKENSIFVTCAAGLKQYQLEYKYDPAYVINTAYFRACDAIDKGKHIENFPGWVRLTCTNIIRELSREEKKRQKHNRQVIAETLPSPQKPDWLNNEEATPEQRHMRAAFAQLSQLEQDILTLKVVKGLRWKDIQLALVTAGYPLMNTNTLSQKKRRALKHLEESYKAIAT